MHASARSSPRRIPRRRPRRRSCELVPASNSSSQRTRRPDEGGDPVVPATGRAGTERRQQGRREVRRRSRGRRSRAGTEVERVIATISLILADLREKTRPAGLQRILNAQGRANAKRRHPQAPRPHRRARLCEHGVESHRAKQRALARHVRAAHQQQVRRVASEADIVRRQPGGRQQRMGDALRPRTSAPPSAISGNGSSGCSAA